MVSIFAYWYPYSVAGPASNISFPFRYERKLLKGIDLNLSTALWNANEKTKHLSWDKLNIFRTIALYGQRNQSGAGNLIINQLRHILCK